MMLFPTGNERIDHRGLKLVAGGDSVLASADRLPFLLAESLWLVDVCGLSYAEAAAEIGVPRDAVADRLHKARSEIARDLSSG